MAWSPPGAGQLRRRVEFQRRGPQGNDGGVVTGGAWATLDRSRRGRLLPIQGREQVQADRLAGISAWELTVRADDLTRSITTDDRVVNARDLNQVFAIRTKLDLEGRGRWFVLTLEAGTEDGHQQG